MKYDVIVIGSGAGGYYSAISSAERGLKTALIEGEELGGTAFRWGSLAVKRILDEFRGVDENLLREVGIDVKEHYKRKYAQGIRDMSQIEPVIMRKLAEAGVDIFPGEGRITGEGENRIEVLAGRERIEGGKLVIATGSRGETLWRGERIITHKELLAMEELPERICIVGGGVEGVEIANITSYMGIETVVVEMEEFVLKGTEDELVSPVMENLKKRGTEIYLNTRVEECVDLGDRVRVSLSGREDVEFPLVVVTGIRRSSIPEGADVDVEDGYIVVDENYRTSNEKIYAVGDINGIMGMANAARYQGEQMGDILTGKISGIPYPESLSRAIYTIPEIACTGFEGKYSGIGYFRDTFRGFSKGVEEGFVVVHSDDGKSICGISMSGEDVSEYLGPLGYLVDKKLDLEEARKIMMAHPTMMEAFHDAVEDVIKKLCNRT